MSTAGVQIYTVGLQEMDWNAAMNRIERSRQNAVVRDLNQDGPMTGVRGEYYDAWVDGEHLCSFDSESEAMDAVRSEVLRRRRS